MLLKSDRLTERQEGLEKIERLFKEKYKTLVVHYSCESFLDNPHGRTPRVTSICVKYLETGQTKSYSIHLQAQFEDMDFTQLSETEYDLLEKAMLDEFFDFVEEHQMHNWVHWNMRNANYGFEAINNRYRILGGTPKEINPSTKFDLSRVLTEVYTLAYETDKPNGKMLNLCARNGLSAHYALPGREEAEAFHKREYLKLHSSTLRKVDLLAAILGLARNGTLKVAVSRKEQFGVNLGGMKEIVNSNPGLNMLWNVMLIVLGALAGYYIPLLLQ